MKSIAAALVLSVLAGQAAGNSTPAQPIGQLALFSPLVGREWLAEFPGNNVTDTQRFEWALGAKFLRNVHHVRAGGKVVYERSSPRARITEPPISWTACAQS
jgi:hypothetical protein